MMIARKQSLLETDKMQIQEDQNQISGDGYH